MAGGTAAADGGLVFDVVDDQRADVHQLGDHQPMQELARVTADDVDTG